jgi:hypothetical protein
VPVSIPAHEKHIQSANCQKGPTTFLQCLFWNAKNNIDATVFVKKYKKSVYKKMFQKPFTKQQARICCCMYRTYKCATQRGCIAVQLLVTKNVSGFF